MLGRYINHQEKKCLEKITFSKVGERPVAWLDDSIHTTPDHKAIVDLDTGKIFSIVSKDYNLLHHEHAIKQVDTEISKTSGLGKFTISTEFYNDGGRMRRTYCFYERKMAIGPNDLVNPELILFNSYDTKWAFMVLLGAFRVVCSNGLVVGKKFLHLRKRHFYDFKQIDLNEQVASALIRFKDQAEQWKRWSTQTLAEKSYFNIMRIMNFGSNAMEEISDRLNQEAEESQGDSFPIITVWAFFNTLTWYITHRTVSLNHQVEIERRLRRAMSYF